MHSAIPPLMVPVVLFNNQKSKIFSHIKLLHEQSLLHKDGIKLSGIYLSGALNLGCGRQDNESKRCDEKMFIMSGTDRRFPFHY